MWRHRVAALMDSVRHVNAVNNAYADVTNELAARLSDERATIEADYLAHGDPARRAREVDQALSKARSAHEQHLIARDGFLAATAEDTRG